jgi:hypothetical protein
MCSPNDTNTRSFPWEVYDVPFQLANVYGVTFAGNSITRNAGCLNSQADYDNPVLLINVQHIVGDPTPQLIFESTGGTAIFAAQTAALANATSGTMLGTQAGLKTRT